MTQRISRGDNCVICVEISEISRETWVNKTAHGSKVSANINGAASVKVDT